MKNTMAKGIVIGAAGVVVLELIFAYAGIVTGMMPANADAKPPAIEQWAAMKSLHAAVKRQAPKGDNPLPLNDENLIAGIRLYAANCAVCHGAADKAGSNIAKGLYQNPPQLADEGVEDDPDGVTFWKIDHGIRMTGMPAYRSTLSEQEKWQITLFLKHMDALSPAAQAQWLKVPSAAAPAPAPAKSK